MNTIVANNNSLSMASVNGTSSSTSMLESLCIDNIEDDSLDLILEDEDDSLDICMLDDDLDDDSLTLILDEEDDSLDICLLDDDVEDHEDDCDDYDEDYEDDYDDYGSGYEWTDEDAWDAMTDGQYGDYPGSGWDPEMFGY